MSTQIAETASHGIKAGQRTRLIDTDVHNSVHGNLAARLAPTWRTLYESGFVQRGHSGLGITRPRVTLRHDAYPPSGGIPGSDRDFLIRHHLDRWGINYAVLNPEGSFGFGGSGGEYSAALCAALNDEVLENWLLVEPRFYASLAIPSEEPDLAVREIERLGANPRFLQIITSMVSREPLGIRKYWPIYEAATDLRLPFAVHVSGWSGHPLSPAGWHSFYLENHVLFQLNGIDQVISMIVEGVFDRFPNLRFVLQEAGFSWVLPLMWRLDNAYALLREMGPPLQRKPSDYLRENVWFTTQPFEEPHRPQQLLELVEAAGIEEHLMFSSDYPHWDFNPPDQSLPKGTPGSLRQHIFFENALDLYERLPDWRDRR